MGAEGSYQDDLTRPVDIVRSMLGDIDVENDALLRSDDYYDALIISEGSINAAALVAARGLLAQYAHQPSSASANGVSVNYADRLTIWSRIVAALAVAATPGRSALSFVTATYNASTELDEYDRHGY